MSGGTGFAPTTTQITTTARPQAVHIVHHQAHTAQQQQPITNDPLQRSIGSILTLQEDPDITEQLREKRMRAKWAEAARSRYARMTPDERRNHNNRRRMRQMQNALNAIKVSFGGREFLKFCDFFERFTRFDRNGFAPLYIFETFRSCGKIQYFGSSNISLRF